MKILLILSIFYSSLTFSYFDFNSKTDIEFKNLSQKKYKVIYFINADCPCSQSHFDHINALSKKYSDFAFIGVHVNKDIPRSRAQKYVDGLDIKFPVLDDKDLELANKYSALKTPHLFIVDKDDKIVFQGGATNSRNPSRATKFYLQDALKALDAGQMPEVKIAKTLGCYIKR